MAIVGQARGEGRAVEENEFFLAGGGLDALLKNRVIFPEGQHFFFYLWKADMRVD
jgi:hypothetical protein